MTARDSLSRFDAEVTYQNLFFQGKKIKYEFSQFDYSVKLNDMIQLMVRKLLAGLDNLPKKETVVMAAAEAEEGAGAVLGQGDRTKVSLTDLPVHQRSSPPLSPSGEAKYNL